MIAGSDHGYAMAALLVGLAAMAVLLGVAMPVWRAIVQREREEELVFRGEQYVRSIRLFQRKYANAYPPNLDILIDQRFLRKRYRDPVTNNGDFVLLYQGMLQPSAGAPRGATQRGAGPGPAGAAPAQPSGGVQTPPLADQQAAGPRGGIVGVVSRSTEKSFRIYNGRSAYNEWQFVAAPASTPGRGAPTPGGRGMGPSVPGVQRPGRPVGGRGAPGPGGSAVPPPGR